MCDLSLSLYVFIRGMWVSVEARGGCGILWTGGCEISSMGLRGWIRVLKEQQELLPPVWVLSSPLSSPFQCLNYSSICGPSWYHILCIFTKVQLIYHKLHIYIYISIYLVCIAWHILVFVFLFNYFYSHDYSVKKINFNPKFYFR